MSGIMVAIMAAVLVAVVFVVAACSGVFLLVCKMTRRPSELVVLPPEGQTFPNGRAFLHFYIRYAQSQSPLVNTQDSNAFTTAGDNPQNSALVDVPENAKLTFIFLSYGGESLHKTFWPQTIQLSDSVKGMEIITLHFSLPGDKWGITRYFRLFKP